MRRKLAALLAATIAVGLSGSVSAQISTVDMSTLDADDLVSTLMGPGVAVVPLSETYTGADIAAGTFSGAAPVFGGPAFDSGVILSTGSIELDCKPTNDFTGYGNVDVVNGTPGDGDLDSLLTTYYGTFDAASLEFSFTCDSVEQLSFVFVFASEEYNEFIESLFFWSDGFAFYVNGVNTALVPVAPFDLISTATINRGYSGDYGNPGHSANPGFYRNNVEKDGIDGIAHLGYNDWEDLPIAMDGMTVLMAVDVPLPSLGPHTIKMVIADVDDRFVDSAVFMFAGTFTAGDPLAVELGDFAGRVDRSGRVLVGWETLSEIDNAGFNVWREPWSDKHLIAPSPGSVLINQGGLIPARGNPFAVTPYRWFDQTGQRGDVYHYWLEDIDNSGFSSFHGPFIVR